MRGGLYDFNSNEVRRHRGFNVGNILLFTLRVLAFGGAIFCIIAYWPDNWMELLIGFLEWLRYR